MPTWLQILFACIGAAGGLSGAAGLVGAFVGFGKVLETVRHLGQQVDQIPALAADVAYIKGRLDGRQEGLDETRPTPARRRRPTLKAISGS